MKLLITIKLGDINLRNHIYPLSKMENVDKIIIVRDTAGPKLEKVIYYCPPSWSLKIFPLQFIFKFFLMVYLGIKEKPKIIMGYRLFPHSILAYIVGKLIMKKVGINFISGPIEFFGPRDSIGKVMYTRPLPDLPLYGHLIRYIAKTADILIVGGTYTKSFLENLGIEGSKIYILPKPMILFNQTFIEKSYDIIFLGRLVRLKHVETVINAINIIKRVCPNIKVAIVGNGPEYLKIAQLSDSLGLSNTIQFLGWQDDPWNWINRSKISILTSEREGFPQFVMQSLYCGVPVVSSKCGDITDVIISRYNGILIDDHNDIESFANSIIWLLQNPEILNEYSKNAIKTITEKYTLQTAQKVWSDIFNSVEKVDKF